MKTFVIALSLIFSTCAFAGELTKVDSTTATKKIIATDNQAAAYVDAAEMDEFIEMLKTDPASPLAQLIKQIEVANECTAKEKAEYYCGEVRITSGVITSFGRGGWADAGASYRFFVGFVEAGSGHFYQAEYVFEVTEFVDAQNSPEGDEPVEFLKTLHYNGSRNISQDELK